MDPLIKKELHQLIDECNNELLLDEVKAILETDKPVIDWWDDLTDEDKNLIKESEVQYGKGNYINHQQLMQQFGSMEKEIVWTEVAQKDFWQIVNYLNDSWPDKVLERFQKLLYAKTKLLVKQPEVGFKSKKYSKYRRTLVTRHYMLIYTVSKEHIVIHRLKHVSLK